MFESIDRPVDWETRRRSATSFALTTLFYASLAGGIAGFLTWQVEPETAAKVELPMSRLKEPAGGELPGPPELPAKPSAPAKPAPTEPTEPQLLADPQPEVAPVQPSPQQPSDGNTQGTGGAGGAGTSTGTGDGPGGCSGPDCGTVEVPKVVVHRLQMEARKRVEPRYPEAARALGLGQQRCLALVSVDEEGIPYEVEISGCPLAFHPATREALLAWRFYPPKMGKERVKGQMSIAVTYRLED
jgi:outer membrane biosynthesis protein TonB